MSSSTQKTIDEMKAMADYLVPYSFPKVSFNEEQQILCLKQKILCIDGYETLVCYSKADYEKYLLETLQIQSQHVPFMPFNVICKMGRLFLGDNNLCYMDTFRNNRKIYCWAIKSTDGQLISPSDSSSPAAYEGFEYNLLKPGTVELF